MNTDLAGDGHVLLRVGDHHLCQWCCVRDDKVDGERLLLAPCLVTERPSLFDIEVKQANPPHVRHVVINSGDFWQDSGTFRVVFRQDGVKFGHLFGGFADKTREWSISLVNYVRAHMAVTDPDYFTRYVAYSPDSIHVIASHEPDEVPKAKIEVDVFVGVVLIMDVINSVSWESGNTYMGGRTIADKSLLLLVQRGDTWTLPRERPGSTETDVMTINRLGESMGLQLETADNLYLGAFHHDLSSVREVNLLYMAKFTGRVDDKIPHKWIERHVLEHSMPENTLDPLVRQQVLPQLADRKIF